MVGFSCRHSSLVYHGLDDTCQMWLVDQGLSTTSVHQVHLDAGVLVSSRCVQGAPVTNSLFKETSVCHSGIRD